MKEKGLDLEEQHKEILKAVAQAWYNHSGSSKPMTEFDAQSHPINFKGNPSRFKLEALGKLPSVTATWDFKQSLWDSYELVTVSRRLETGLALDNPFAELSESSRIHRRRKQESKNSLRNLFNKMSSSRFDDTNIPQENHT